MAQGAWDCCRYFNETANYCKWLPVIAMLIEYLANFVI